MASRDRDDEKSFLSRWSQRKRAAEAEAPQEGEALRDESAAPAAQLDAVDPTAGFVLLKKPGETVEAGEPLVEVYAADASRLDTDAVRGAFSFSETQPDARPLLLDRYDENGWQSRTVQQ